MPSNRNTLMTATENYLDAEVVKGDIILACNLGDGDLNVGADLEVRHFTA